MKKLLIYTTLLLTLVACSKVTLDEYYFFDSVIQVEEITKYTLAERLAQDPNSILFKGLPNKKIKVARIRYKTLDPKGNPIMASGAIFYPTAKTSHTRSGTILGVHYTYGANWEVPSERGAVTEALFSVFGYVVVAPDYIGYGESQDVIHPYYDVISTGQASADMMMAAKEYFASIGRKIDHKITIMCYSQGGPASLATLKFLETEIFYKDAFIIDQVFAGGGAYDLIQSYDTFVEEDYSSQPVTIPLLILGLDYGDSLNLDLTKMFAEPLLSNFQEWIISKKYTTDAVTEMMGETQLTKIMAPEAFDTTHPNTMKFRESLRNNSLIVKGGIKDWVPKNRITLLHATNDHIVPYANTASAYKAFRAAGCNVTLYDLKGHDHKDGGPVFYTYCMKKLVIN